MSDIATHADFTVSDLIDQLASDYDDGLEEVVLGCPRCGGQGTLRITGIRATPAASCSQCSPTEPQRNRYRK